MVTHLIEIDLGQPEISLVRVTLMTLLLINFNFSEVCWQSRIWSILIRSIFIWSIIATHRTSSLTIPKFKNLFSEAPSNFTKSYHGSFQSFFDISVEIINIFQKTYHMTPIILAIGYGVRWNHQPRSVPWHFNLYKDGYLDNRIITTSRRRISKDEIKPCQL